MNVEAEVMADAPVDMVRRDRRRRAPHSTDDDVRRTDRIEDMICARWNVKILRSLTARDCRFGQLKDMIPDVSANVLSRRLKELEAAGLVTRVRLSQPADCWIYRLSEAGRGAKPVIDAIDRWAQELP
jgi:DNA-binding HxlR family transcriptional regulator